MDAPDAIAASTVDAAMVATVSDAPVDITVADPGGRLGRRPILRFHRAGRTPAIVERPLLVGSDRRARLIGWTPVELAGVDVVAGPDGRPDGAAPTIRIRRLGLAEMVVRAAFAAPLGFARVIRLQLAGNRAGRDFRFARLWDTISAPRYRDWAALHSADDVAAAAALDLDARDGPRMLVVVDPGGASARARTRADLAAETAVRVVDVDPAAGLPPAEPDDLLLRLSAGVRLTPGALAHLVAPFRGDDPPALVWCDEDRLDPFGRRRDPLFGPVWDPLLVAAGALPLSAAVIRRDRLPAGLDPVGAPIADLALGAVGGARDAVVQVPRLLVHVPGRRPSIRPVAAPRLAEDVRPSVSVVIPSRDRADLLGACLDGLAGRTAGIDLEVMVVDNGSVEPATAALYAARAGVPWLRVLPAPGPFDFARLCNLGVAASRHELVLLLNNDVEPLEPGWLRAMVAETADGSVGVVGARLVYPDGLVQHGGVVLGVHPLAQHADRFRALGGGEDGGRLSLRRETSVVTAACLLTRRSLWRSVGGMDEGRLAVAYNDVDYCLAVRARGARVIWTPAATLVHHESPSRGGDDTLEKRARFAREEALVATRWRRALAADPFGNPNFAAVGEPFVVTSRPGDLSPRRMRVPGPDGR